MAEPQVWSTDVMAIFAPKCFGSAAIVSTEMISKVVSPLDQLAKKSKKDEPPK